MPATRRHIDAVRVVRAVLLPTASFALTWTAHVAAGGRSADLPAVAVPLLAISAAGIGMADKPRRPLATWALLGTTQLVSHVFLSLIGGHATTGSAEPARMLLGHVLVAGLLAGLLTHAETVLAAIGRLAPRRRGAFRRAIPDGPLLVLVDVVFLPRSARLRHSVPRRGPPRLR